MADPEPSISTGFNWKTVAAVLGSIAAVLTGAAALVSSLNLGGSDPPQTQSQPLETPGQSPVSGTSSEVEPTLANPTIRDAERLATQWIEAVLEGDVDALVALAEPPYFMDRDIYISKTDIRAEYEAEVGGRPQRSLCGRK